jgi:hypothetical protein
MRTPGVRSIRITLLVGLATIVASLAVVLGNGAPRLTGSNNIPAAELLEELPPHGGRHCQDGEELAQRTAALRLSLQSTEGPPIRVVALADGHAVASGRRAAGWSGSSVVVPLSRTPHRDVPVRICVEVGPSSEHVDMLGATAAGRIRIDGLFAGRPSWWSLAPAIVTRLGRGHAWSGPSVALAAGVLALAAIALALRQLMRVEADEAP